MKPRCVTIQIKVTEQYFHVVLFIMLHKVVLTFKCENGTTVCDHSNESEEYFNVFIKLHSMIILALEVEKKKFV